MNFSEMFWVNSLGIPLNYTTDLDYQDPDIFKRLKPEYQTKHQYNLFFVHSIWVDSENHTYTAVLPSSY